MLGTSEFWQTFEFMFWWTVSGRIGPQPKDCLFGENLEESMKRFNSLVMLGAWILWKHHNACIFDGSAPCLQVALQAYRDELHLWQAVGAKGLRALSVGRVD
ncbi:hypothetical protein PVAP13_9KG545500 [Panicum virgatum]|uniref:Uncharacterized protein n=1 Tax=Panicum virgatum TaxID=38727 RepID=A0A8T0P775_PANVG|nr:hypothetical protein PVAP13_9KG545500 [Panicum virgatum]